MSSCDTFVFTTQYEFMWYICIYYSIWVHVIHLYLLLNMSSCDTFVFTTQYEFMWYICMYYSIWVHLIHLYLLLNMSSCDTFVFTTQYEFMWYICIYYSIRVHLIHLYLQSCSTWVHNGNGSIPYYVDFCFPLSSTRLLPNLSIRVKW
jgi:hypothetical protein